MSESSMKYALNVRGSQRAERSLVDAATALSAYAECDDRIDLNDEAYLSAWRFGSEFCEYFKRRRSEKGFNGVCWSDWLWFDIDNANLTEALDVTRKLSGFLVDKFRLEEDQLLVFFSGRKGFHVGLPTSLWQPQPSTEFVLMFKRLAEQLAEDARVIIDGSIYSKVRLFRAPNSRHPSSGLHKRRFAFDAVLGLKLEAILALAKEPEAFDLPTAPPVNPEAVELWASLAQTDAKSASHSSARPNGTEPRLNRNTLDFLHNGATDGERATRLFSAAANIGEFSLNELAHALLTEPARDSGLAPREIRRQIEAGLRHAKQQKDAH